MEVAFSESTTIANSPSKENKVTDQSQTETNADHYINLESRYGCHNYHPIPVVLKSAKGCIVVDVDGKKYFDFLCGYSAVSQGHLHPRVIAVAKKQLDEMTLCARAFYNDKLGLAEQKICNLFGYDKCLFMNTGVEAVESALKLARRWGYKVKRIPDNEALIIVGSGNFHGRTITVVSFSCDESSRGQFGPYTPGFITAEYGNLEAMRNIIEEHGPKICGVLLEPVQGEGGVIIPPKNYLRDVANLCKEHKILLIADEIQAGLGRTGDLLCHYHNDEHPSETPEYKPTTVRADIVCLAKALGSGVLPVSCVLADDEVMMTIGPDEHGSTYGGNPLAAAVAMESLNVIIEEKLPEQSKTKGAYFGGLLQKLQSKYPSLVKLVRGRGLFWGLVISESLAFDARAICIEFKNRGLLAKPTHVHTIRFSPAITITLEEIDRTVEIMDGVLSEFNQRLTSA